MEYVPYLPHIEPITTKGSPIRWEYFAKDEMHLKKTYQLLGLVDKVLLGLPTIPLNPTQMNELEQLVNDMLTSLSEREALVIKQMHFGGKNKQEVARLLKTTRERIAQIYNRGISKLRDTKRKNKLVEYLNELAH